VLLIPNTFATRAITYTKKNKKNKKKRKGEGLQNEVTSHI